MKTPTLTEVREALRAEGLTVTRTGHGQEVKVRVKGSPAGEGYFTDDMQDALDTGRDMARRAAAQEA